MIKVTEKEIIDFIMAQPRDRPLNMNDNFTSDECGCIMVHYGKARGFKFNWCGYNIWGKMTKDSKVITVAALANGRYYNDFAEESHKTYGEVQEYLNNKK